MQKPTENTAGCSVQALYTEKTKVGVELTWVGTQVDKGK